MLESPIDRRYVDQLVKGLAEAVCEAFENLAGRKVQLGLRESAMFLDLVHPVHANGRVFGWEIGAQGSTKLG